MKTHFEKVELSILELAIVRDALSKNWDSSMIKESSGIDYCILSTVHNTVLSLLSITGNYELCGCLKVESIYLVFIKTDYRQIVYVAGAENILNPGVLELYGIYS